MSDHRSAIIENIITILPSKYTRKHGKLDAYLILHIFRVTIYTKQMATAESKGFGVVDSRVEADTALEGSVRRGAAIF